MLPQIALAFDAFLPPGGSAVTQAEQRSLVTREGPQKSITSLLQAIAPLAMRDAFKTTQSPTTQPWCAESNWNTGMRGPRPIESTSPAGRNTTTTAESASRSRRRRECRQTISTTKSVIVDQVNLRRSSPFKTENNAPIGDESGARIRRAKSAQAQSVQRSSACARTVFVASSARSGG